MRQTLYTLTLTAFLVCGQLEAQISSPQKVLVKDEGTIQGIVGQVDCVGAGIACTRSGDVATLTVSGGATPSFGQVTIDFDACNPAGPTRGSYSCSAIFGDAAVSGASRILLSVMDDLVGHGIPADEIEMTPIVCNTIPGAGVFTLNCYSVSGPAEGKFNVNYYVG